MGNVDNSDGLGNYNNLDHLDLTDESLSQQSYKQILQCCAMYLYIFQAKFQGGQFSKFPTRSILRKNNEFDSDESITKSMK